MGFLLVIFLKIEIQGVIVIGIDFALKVNRNGNKKETVNA
jgi:mannose/fructose/N-acetylgalactosamine-specific phosphotransferase system component IIC